ncbi:hypothetical protein D3C80_1670360 [compost metagenome]
MSWRTVFLEHINYKYLVENFNNLQLLIIYFFGDYLGTSFSVSDHHLMETIKLGK